MRVVVIGLGVQGMKRLAIAGDDVVATIDPFSHHSVYKSMEEIPPESFDAAIIATPDSEKDEIVSYLVKNGKHVMIEKPLTLHSQTKFNDLENLANSKRVFLYTAYNHRFEPHFKNAKNLLDEKRIGNIYSCRIFYGNGTAQLVKNSAWRDHGSGVLSDLGSHILDTADFWFGASTIEKPITKLNKFENNSPDYANVLFKMRDIHFSIEMSLCSWKNSFECDIIGSLGSLHIRGLCKWGESHLIYRIRSFPSGVPNESTIIEPQGDPTWKLEYKFFLENIRAGSSTSLKKDAWLSSSLENFYTTAVI